MVARSSSTSERTDLFVGPLLAILRNDELRPSGARLDALMGRRDLLVLVLGVILPMIVIIAVLTLMH